MPDNYYTYYPISIHTPARGVTGIYTSTACVATISIHTPARGVTPYVADAFLLGRYFNPHSRKGSDITQGSNALYDFKFQSTLPQGE